MKKTLILAAFGLLASLAPPAFASDSPGTYFYGKGATALNQQTIKESSTTFVIAKADNKVKDVTATLATSKPGADDIYLVKHIDSGPTAPGLITANHDKVKGDLMISSSMKRDNKGGGVLAFDTKAPQVGLDLKTAPMTSASGLTTSTEAGGSYST